MRILAVLTVLMFCLGMAECGKPFKLPTPTGPYGIGSYSSHIVSSTYEEPRFGSPNAKREFMVHYYYPAKVPEGSKSLPYFLPLKNLIKHAAEFSDSEVKKYTTGTWATALTILQASLGTSVFPGAPAVIETLPFPVIILSHGLDGNHNFHFATIQELVSQGYIVAAIEHTFSNTIAEFPDGRVYPPKRLSNELTETLEMETPIRVGDIKDVVEELASATTLPFSADSSRIGILGHSLGGGTAVVSMADSSLDIKAAFILDGVDFTGQTTTLSQPVKFWMSADPKYQMKRPPRGSVPIFACSTLLGLISVPPSACEQPPGILHNAYLDFSVLRDIFSFESYQNMFLQEIGPSANTEFVVRMNQAIVDFFKTHLL